MHGGPRFSGCVTSVKGLRTAIVTNDRVCPLNEINHSRPVLVTMQADATARFDGEQAEPQLPSGHSLKFGAHLLAVNPLLSFGASSALAMIAPHPRTIAEAKSARAILHDFMIFLPFVKLATN
jgi:hypothetical protein